MLRNYLKIAYRNLLRNKLYSGINIVGLAVGLSACIVIMLFVNYENGYDRIHTKNLYRLDEVQKFEGMVAPQKVALSMYPMGPTLQEEYPEVKNFVRIDDQSDVILNHNDKKVELPTVLSTDANFLKMFDFELIEGDRALVLAKPNSVVLTQKSATKIFGSNEPIGQTLMSYGRDTLAFKVTGVLENLPANSHLQFDALFSMSTFVGPQAMNNWGGNWLVTYLELEKGADIAAMEKKFPDYLKGHMSEEGAKQYELFLQPLTEVHGNSTDITHDYMNFQKFDRTYTYIFSIIALIVLVIACVNFMNLSTARSTGRAKEVGIRKAVGAQRFQLAGQFIGESILLAFSALILAVVLVLVTLPYINRMSDRSLDFAIFTDPKLLLTVLGGTILIGILSGLYPAAYLSSFEAAKVLKGSIRTGKSTFRNALVVAQFSCAVFLIIGTGFALKQLHFMRDKDPGFQTDQVVLIPLNAKSWPKYQSLKKELLANSQVEAVSGSGQRLGNNLHQWGMQFQGDGPVRQVGTSNVVVDPDYLSLYKIELVAGRNFRDDASDNGRTFIINESLAKELLKDEAEPDIASLVGKRFGGDFADSLGTIVGIAKDFNFNSLHHKIETLSMYNQQDWGYDEMSVRIKGKNSRQAVAAIEKIWRDQVPEQTFSYSFLDEHFTKLYRADSQVSEIVGILAGLAVFISALGLFGLASYSAERRVKEIGVRKVLGASVVGIVGLLSKDFLKLVFAAIFIAVPVAWLAVNSWLQDFAYHIDIDIWLFLAAGLLAVCIAQLTVTFQSMKAALVNPVKSLRSE
ncbi:ABC transporter permease [Persicitalea jodogahamensis]|uniref:ABC transporter permease n=1 Tax=Persicitalea jodogahamensis TaxID=402147 RepID=A0A8J3G8G1_9BACT|nr:ABC transporter permease [Persicitalea jodogahamensis]GHB54867.1 ABC transporter permease [Persicitalea jodogahamensis]